MNCPYCNSDETYKLLFGKISDEMQVAIDSGLAFCIHASQIGKPVPVQENLFYCKDCKKTFTAELEDEIFIPTAEELIAYYTVFRMKYRPKKVKYLILSDVPTDIYPDEAPAFFYTNPDRTFYNNLYEEVITTLFFPPEFVDKTRTIGLSIEKETPSMDKYLTMFKEQGFFQMDAIELPACTFVDYSKSRSSVNRQIKQKMIEWQDYTLDHIYQISDKDTKIIIVKKDVYEVYYPILSKKYKILNDYLDPIYGKPYICSPVGHQKEFRQKLYQCLKSDDYEFEKDFSYIHYKDF